MDPFSLTRLRKDITLKLKQWKQTENSIDLRTVPTIVCLLYTSDAADE